jgi:hypothetical protein
VESFLDVDRLFFVLTEEPVVIVAGAVPDTEQASPDR